MPTRTEAIKRFLNHSTESDLAELYTADMEVQVNVAQDGGERIDGDFKGKKWHGWSDSLTTWKSFRIPYRANIDPEYEDKEIKFDLAAHAEGVGMTGWDWENRCSKWVAFDFDAIMGHSDKHTHKLTNEQLEEVKQTAISIDWVTIRKSASGKGLHLYVFLDEVPTQNHNEHAALARAIIGKMSAITGFDFQSQVDICGGNMWVWHRKTAGTDGFKLIKKGTILRDVPLNWKDHIQVVSGRRRKNMPQDITGADNIDLFDELAGQRPVVGLDEAHKKLIQYLTDVDAVWWWDQDHHMLVTHTIYLKDAHKDLGMRGFFETTAVGTERGADHNCFLFPMRRGAWAVRRFSPGTQEHDSWDQDGAGWTRSYLNREPDLKAACRAYGGLEDPTGGFVFREAEMAMKAAQLLGVTLNIGAPLMSRETKLKQHKDGRLVATVERKEVDRGEEMMGWLPKKGDWTKIHNTQVSAPAEPDMGNYDDMVRHLVTESGEDYGWMIKSDGYWRSEPLAHIRIALASLGLKHGEVSTILGSSIFKCWKVVNKPFQPEYPGDREWNRNAAQFRFLPTRDRELHIYPTWFKILNHCGSGLNETIQHNGWCKANGIVTGADYLKCWIASLFREPLEPLPYLFMYGPQNSGKSIFHEALSLLLTRGYKRADAALISQAGFNAELEGAIICVVEETDLKRNRAAYNRIKDWVTSRELLIHCKGKTPYHIPNTTHWVQCANEHQACPIFTGDTRITMLYVEPLDPVDMIPKKKLIPMLEREAPDFLAEVIGLELPPSSDRLNVPVVETDDKSIAQQLNQTQLEMFVSEKTQLAKGYSIKFSDFYDKFQEWMDPNEVHLWSKIRVGRELPPQLPKGRRKIDGQFYIGNVCWAGTPLPEDKETKKIVSRNGYLVEIEND